MFIKEKMLLKLDTLLVNLRGNQEAVVVVNDGDIIEYGNERRLRKTLAPYLSYLVSNIFINEDNRLQINVTSDKCVL